MFIGYRCPFHHLHGIIIMASLLSLLSPFSHSYYSSSYDHVSQVQARRCSDSFSGLSLQVLTADLWELSLPDVALASSSYSPPPSVCHTCFLPVPTLQSCFSLCLLPFHFQVFTQTSLSQFGLPRPPCLNLQSCATALSSSWLYFLSQHLIAINMFDTFYLFWYILFW